MLDEMNMLVSWNAVLTETVNNCFKNEKLVIQVKGWPKSDDKDDSDHLFKELKKALSRLREIISTEYELS